ncbi:unnamed protein product, partial [Adineta ricciae]
QESRPDKRASSTVTKSITEDHTANLAEIIHQGKAITNIDEEKERAISQTDIQPKLVGAVDNMNEIMIDTIESTTRSQIGEPVPPLPTDTIKELVLNISNEEKQHEQNLPTKRVDLPSTSFSSQKPDFNQTHTQSTEEPIVNENSSV